MPAPDAIRQRRYDLGKAVAQQRRAQGLTQEELAAIVGCDRKSINRLENGSHAITLDRLWPVADALKLTIGDLDLSARKIANERSQRPERK